MAIHAHARWREWGLLGEYKKSATWGDAIIEDDYVKENGVWKIAARRYYLNFEAPYQGGWAALKPVTGDRQSAVAKDFPPGCAGAQAVRALPGRVRAAVPLRQRQPQGDPEPAAVRFAQARPTTPSGKLEALADAKELQLARTHSVRAIENLQAMYGYYIDKGQWKKAAALVQPRRNVRVRPERRLHRQRPCRARACR